MIQASSRAHRMRLVFSLIVLLAGLLAFVEMRRLGSLYWHDVAEDHRYEFQTATTVPIDIGADGFTLSLPEGNWHGAFLSMEVSSSLVGRWSEPWLECVLPDGRRFVQHLERGARGRRYLNLGPLNAGGAVELRGHHVGWKEQRGQLLLFEPPQLNQGPLLVLATHPDDAEIAAFGLYSSTDAWIVTVTAGDGVDRRMEHLEADPRARSRLKGELRVWDSLTIPRWGGVPAERALNLGYHTLSLASLYAQPERVHPHELLGDGELELFRSVEGFAAVDSLDAAASWGSLVSDLAALVAAIDPQAIVTPYPELDAAADHKLTTVALLEALEQLGAADRVLLLYTNHHATSEYFPFGPAHSVVSLPPWTEKPLLARGVYSHGLDPETRLRKLYALEAQHDLRAAPRHVSPSPAGHFFGEIWRKLNQLRLDPTDTYSYMRRAARPNELFLTASDSDATALLKQSSPYLEGLRADPE